VANLFEKLNRIPVWQKLAALVVLALVVVAAFYYGQWKPLDEKLAGLKTTYTDLERRYKEQKAIADDLATFQQNIRRLEEDLRIALTQLPRDKEIPTLLRDIYLLGKKSGVDFKSFQPQAEQPKQMYAEVPIKLQLTGTYHEIGVFFDRIGKLSRIVNVSDIDLGGVQSQKDGGEPQLTVNCTATTFMFSGGGS
jgi:type IV pilus assembly protein PilO